MADQPRQRGDIDNKTRTVFDHTAADDRPGECNDSEIVGLEDSAHLIFGYVEK